MHVTPPNASADPLAIAVVLSAQIPCICPATIDKHATKTGCSWSLMLSASKTPVGMPDDEATRWVARKHLDAEHEIQACFASQKCLLMDVQVQTQLCHRCQSLGCQLLLACFVCTA